MNKYVYGISARIECLGGDVLVKTRPGKRISLGWRLKTGWRLMKLGMRIAAKEREVITVDTKTCATCKWRSDDFTSVCVNGDSERRADFVDADGTCPEWEGRTDYTCRTCRWYSGHSRSVCACDASEYLSRYVTPAETCPEWEEKRDE